MADAQINQGPRCPKCGAEWKPENVCVWDVDGADQCEDGRFESPTYSISIVCHDCQHEMFRNEGANSCYGECERTTPTQIEGEREE